jgi:LacI family transcriptional regulator
VSPSTVSAVLNGNVLVSKERTLRVQSAIQALGFEPNQVARSLKTGRTNTVGVIVPDIRITFYPDLLRSIEDAARKRLYTVLFCDSNDDLKLEQDLLQAFSARRVDGILLTCSAPSIGAGILTFKSCPIVFVDRIPSGVTDWGVTTDNTGAGSIATRHLLALGHRRIAILSGRSSFSPHSDRVLGFRKTMEAADIAVLPKYAQECDMPVESAYATAKELLSVKPRPTAVICTNQRVLFALLRSVHEAKLSYPSDLSIVTFDDSPWNEYVRPTLTTVVQPTYGMGRSAFDMLLRRMRPDLNEKPPTPEGIKLLQAELKIRESTAEPYE